MINFVSLYFPDAGKTQIGRLLIKAGFKVFLRSLRKQVKNNETD
ncbi:hypothetical protein LCGC14_1221040 [marine sediment metagenome]|uniref:Uncharacterized protein n=1 Tax=marine sediment metagenome TaxID=412755 RepID=A0A0F9NTJ9_9ZZZZ